MRRSSKNLPHYPDDITLWTAFQRGEKRAEADFFEKYFRPVTLFAERFTGQLPPAEDIATETLLKVWDRRQEFATLDNARAFLYRAVRNAGINYAESQKTHRDIHARIAHLLKDGPDDANETLESEILRVELLHEIYKEIDTLPEKCGQVFRLLFIHHKSTREAAEELGIHIQTVRTQKARAIGLLRTELLKRHRLDAFILFCLLLDGIKK